MSAGFLVIDTDLETPLWLLKRDNALWKHVPADGVLLIGAKKATVFPTRAAAKRAIKSTRAYFLSCHPRRVEASIYAIWRLVP